MFCAGEKVRFKTWKELRSEFGTDENGIIDCGCGFTREMNNDILKGKVYTIEDITMWGTVVLKEPYTKSGTEYNISEDMLVHVADINAFYELSSDEVKLQ